MCVTQLRIKVTMQRTDITGYFFDIYMSVHRNIIPNYNQQDATFLDLFIFTDA